jgi:hypothetical protein
MRQVTSTSAVQSGGFFSALSEIVANEGLAGLYRGVFPALLLVSVPMSQFWVCVRVCVSGCKCPSSSASQTTLGCRVWARECRRVGLTFAGPSGIRIVAEGVGSCSGPPSKRGADEAAAVADDHVPAGGMVEGVVDAAHVSAANHSDSSRRCIVVGPSHCGCDKCAIRNHRGRGPATLGGRHRRFGSQHPTSSVRQRPPRIWGLRAAGHTSGRRAGM